MNRTPEEWIRSNYCGEVADMGACPTLYRAIQDIQEQASRIADLEEEREQAVVNADRQLRLISTLQEREDKLRKERDMAKICADCVVCEDDVCANSMRERGKG